MKLIKILFALILALVIANVTLTNRSVDEGIVLSGLAREISSLQDQNTIMRAQIALDGSLGSLNTKLIEANFVSSPTIVALSDNHAVASR